MLMCISKLAFENSACHIRVFEMSVFPHTVIELSHEVDTAEFPYLRYQARCSASR